ncbi:hypothetical protein O3P69_014974 [Scylla paramamosain]|uniref:Uncharacterized protein n=1 Tax=Scylla paramamosain TaxID=85552 RepID=A0AAW0SCW1_SCYPA
MGGGDGAGEWQGGRALCCRGRPLLRTSWRMDNLESEVALNILNAVVTNKEEAQWSRQGLGRQTEEEDGLDETTSTMGLAAASYPPPGCPHANCPGATLTLALHTPGVWWGALYQGGRGGGGVEQQDWGASSSQNEPTPAPEDTPTPAPKPSPTPSTHSSIQHSPGEGPGQAAKGRGRGRAFEIARKLRSFSRRELTPGSSRVALSTSVRRPGKVIPATCRRLAPLLHKALHACHSQPALPIGGLKTHAPQQQDEW